LSRLWWMTVALIGYLKSHPATKQESQPRTAEQSALRKFACAF